MPTTFLSSALNWVATHLILFSFLGFLLVGLAVTGAIEVPGTTIGGAGAVTDEEEATGARPGASSGQGEEGRVPDDTVPGSERDAGPTADSGSGAAQGQARPVPRLIGGSLPVYSRTGEDDVAFRPPGATEEPVVTTAEDYLQQARKAFWSGELEASEAAYQALISEHPDDANAYGELGNLYQAMGKSDLALDAYFAAAVRFKASGNREKLNEIMDVLKREKDHRAHQLIP